MLGAPARFQKMLRALEAKGMPLGPDEEAAKTLPRGCEAGRGTALEPFLKHRNLIARHELSDAEISCPGLPMLLLDRFAAARPLLDFGWAVVDG
jgi:uncharacterized protein (DUF2461 family)